MADSPDFDHIAQRTVGDHDMAVAVAEQLRQVWNARGAADRAALPAPLNGIDREETDDPDGWWETSAGAAFGAGVLVQLDRALQNLDR